MEGDGFRGTVQPLSPCDIMFRSPLFNARGTDKEMQTFSVIFMCLRITISSSSSKPAAMSSESSARTLPVPARPPGETDAWILGCGLPSLAAAVHLVQEAKVPAARVHILETLSVAGGSTANGGDVENGYEYRAGAMPAFNDVCVEDLLSQVPSKSRKDKTALDDILEYDQLHPLTDGPGTRFLTKKSKGLDRIEGKRVNLGLRDRMDLFMLASKTEKSLGRSKIQDHFSDSFFRSNYWLTLATTYAFQDALHIVRLNPVADCS